MNNAITFVLYIAVVMAVLQNLFIVAIPLIIWFTVRASALWLLLAAILIDGYFGGFYHIPYLSITICVWILVSELVKPQMLWD